MSDLGQVFGRRGGSFINKAGGGLLVDAPNKPFTPTPAATTYQASTATAPIALAATTAAGQKDIFDTGKTEGFGAKASQDAINQMRNIASGTRTAIEDSALESVRRQQRAEEKTRAESAKRNLSRRGLGNSGASLASALQEGQSAADRYAQQAADINAATEQRRLGATSQLGGLSQGYMGTQLGQNQLGQNLNLANAQMTNQTNQFNTGLAQNTALQNAQMQNQAAMANANAQNTMGAMNTNNLNNYFQNQGQMQMAANQYNANFLRPLAMSGLATGFGLLGVSDKKVKENIVYGGKGADEFMNSIKPYEFNYKSGGDRHLGIMAQDIETESPDLVKEIDGVKNVDMIMSVPKLLASVARLNERLRRLENV